MKHDEIERAHEEKVRLHRESIIASRNAEDARKIWHDACKKLAFQEHPELRLIIEDIKRLKSDLQKQISDAAYMVEKIGMYEVFKDDIR